MTTNLTHLAKACLLLVATGSAMASSHREAPFITTSPKVDGTDFYMFRSYEGVSSAGTGGRSDYVTMIANYQPLQAAYGGPNSVSYTHLDVYKRQGLPWSFRTWFLVVVEQKLSIS